MRRKLVVTVLFPILAALIWGMAFTAQSASADSIGPFTLNACRSTLSALALSLGLFVYNKARARAGKPVRRADTKQALMGGLCCGLALCTATAFQQMGLTTVASGKAGFITAMYVVLVPVFALFLGRKAPLTLWIGVALAAIGLYLLCVNGSLSFEKGDILLILCAAIFAVHILIVDHFTEAVPGVLLSCIQFGFMAVFSWILAFLFETPTAEAIKSCLPQILYLGIISGGVAYTLQIVAQAEADPAQLSLLLSLESVFSVLSGALFLGERLSARELLGCAVMFAAVLLAQIPPEKLFKRKA